MSVYISLLDAVNINEDVTLAGRNFFSSITSTNQFIAASVNPAWINNHIDMATLLSQVVRTDQPAVINGNVTITGNITVRDGDVVIQFLNGVRFEDYMTLNTDQQSTGAT